MDLNDVSVQSKKLEAVIMSWKSRFMALSGQ